MIFQLAFCALNFLPNVATDTPIDRKAVVQRHNVTLKEFNKDRPLQIGNGEFAFGMDITGLQTFVPFNIMSQWGWHTGPLGAGQRIEDFEGQVWETQGRPVRYPMPDPKRPELSAWLGANPHRINLGRIGLELRKRDGTLVLERDIQDPIQQLDLWTGIVTSRFLIEGEPVTVKTACHPKIDSVAVQVESPLVKAGRISIFVTCPGNDPLQFANFVGDWDHPGQFEAVGSPGKDRADFLRKLDNDVYALTLRWDGDAKLHQESRRLTITPGQATSMSVACTFNPKAPLNNAPKASESFESSRSQWPSYWKRGGFIDLSGSQDPRWRELERRVVLSQYLMKVNEAGSLPPQESGLVNNGWYGRFHLEMVWWHMAHWALWNRWPELNKGIGFYKDVLGGAQKLAKSQGYQGARWPKCIGPDGREWPHEIHALLIWQQPHPIFFAELDYRAHPTRATLEKWLPIVEATADFMASYAFLDAKSQRYIIGPPVVLVSENTDAKTTQNPTFELGYWRFGLRTANQWRERMKLPLNAKWEKVLKGLAPLPTQNGLYVLHEGVQDMWTKWTFEHPALTGAFGMLPGDGVDRNIMGQTFDKVSSTWQFDRIWGWDFPMLAMCAARLGKPDKAIDYLLHSADRFQFDVRGLATGGPFPYFPSNGGLLYAIAMMAAGWDGAPKGNAPGFPKNGRWKIRWENLAIAP